MRTALSEHIGQYSGRFKVGGYNTFLDGSPQARTAWLCGSRTAVQKKKLSRLSAYEQRRTGRVCGPSAGRKYAVAGALQRDAACRQYLRVYGGTCRGLALCPVSLLPGNTSRYHPCADACAGPTVPGGTERDDTVFFCGSCIPLGRRASRESRTGTRGAHQPRGLCGYRTGPPLYVPSGCARYPAGHAGDCMVRSEPRYKAGDGAGGQGAFRSWMLCAP